MEVMDSFKTKVRTSNIQTFLKRFNFRLHHYQPNSNALDFRFSKVNDESG